MRLAIDTNVLTRKLRLPVPEARERLQGCRVLLSEDFHTGFTWHGLTVVNPFATPLHPLLQDVLAGA